MRQKFLFSNKVSIKFSFKMKVSKQITTFYFISFFTLLLFFVACAEGRSYKNDRPYKVYKAKEKEDKDAQSRTSEIILAQNNNTITTDDLLKSYREDIDQKKEEDKEKKKISRIIFPSFREHRDHRMSIMNSMNGMNVASNKQNDVEENPSNFKKFWRKMKKIIGFDPTMLLVFISEIIVGLCILNYAVWCSKNQPKSERRSFRGHSIQIQPPSPVPQINHLWSRTPSGNSRLSRLSCSSIAMAPPSACDSHSQIILNMDPSLLLLSPSESLSRRNSTPSTSLTIDELDEEEHQHQQQQLGLNEKVDHPPAYEDLLISQDAQPPSFETVVETEVKRSASSNVNDA